MHRLAGALGGPPLPLAEGQIAPNLAMIIKHYHRCNVCYLSEHCPAIYTNVPTMFRPMFRQLLYITCPIY